VVPLTEDHGRVEREDEVVQLLGKWTAMNGCVVLLVPSAAAVSESAENAARRLHLIGANCSLRQLPFLHCLLAASNLALRSGDLALSSASKKELQRRTPQWIRGSSADRQRPGGSPYSGAAARSGPPLHNVTVVAHTFSASSPARWADLFFSTAQRGAGDKELRTKELCSCLCRSQQRVLFVELPFVELG